MPIGLSPLRDGVKYSPIRSYAVVPLYPTGAGRGVAGASGGPSPPIVPKRRIAVRAGNARGECGASADRRGKCLVILLFAASWRRSWVHPEGASVSSVNLQSALGDSPSLGSLFPTSGRLWCIQIRNAGRGVRVHRQNFLLQCSSCIRSMADVTLADGSERIQVSRNYRSARAPRTHSGEPGRSSTPGRRHSLLVWNRDCSQGRSINGSAGTAGGCLYRSPQPGPRHGRSSACP